jgi:hypothetical protein
MSYIVEIKIGKCTIVQKGLSYDEAQALVQSEEARGATTCVEKEG